MVPHDQQVAVASPAVTTEALGLDSTFVIDVPNYDHQIVAWARNARKRRSEERPRGRGARATPSARERRAATAGLRGIRVYEHEALLHECLLVIQGHAVQVDERFRIDKYPHITELEDAIALPRLRI